MTKGIPEECKPAQPLRPNSNEATKKKKPAATNRSTQKAAASAPLLLPPPDMPQEQQVILIDDPMIPPFVGDNDMDLLCKEVMEYEEPDTSKLEEDLYCREDDVSDDLWGPVMDYIFPDLTNNELLHMWG